MATKEQLEKELSETRTTLEGVLAAAAWALREYDVRPGTDRSTEALRHEVNRAMELLGVEAEPIPTGGQVIYEDEEVVGYTPRIELVATRKAA